MANDEDEGSVPALSSRLRQLHCIHALDRLESACSTQALQVTQLCLRLLREDSEPSPTPKRQKVDAVVGLGPQLWREQDGLHEPEGWQEAAEIVCRDAAELGSSTTAGTHSDGEEDDEERDEAPRCSTSCPYHPRDLDLTSPACSMDPDPVCHLHRPVAVSGILAVLQSVTLRRLLLADRRHRTTASMCAAWQAEWNNNSNAQNDDRLSSRSHTDGLKKVPLVSPSQVDPTDGASRRSSVSGSTKTTVPRPRITTNNRLKSSGKDVGRAAAAKMHTEENSGKISVPSSVAFHQGKPQIVPMQQSQKSAAAAVVFPCGKLPLSFSALSKNFHFGHPPPMFAPLPLNSNKQQPPLVTAERPTICPACVGGTLPDDPINMIACDHCNRWFHFACVGYNAASSTTGNWFCRRCVE